jgi:hypothetical protein
LDVIVLPEGGNEMSKEEREDATTDEDVEAHKTSVRQAATREGTLREGEEVVRTTDDESDDVEGHGHTTVR